jgi:general stress protein 26
MNKSDELASLFWKALESDKTVMLGVDGAEDGHTRPMTAQVPEHNAPIWFFTTRDNALVQRAGKNARAIATFASKGHELFAALQGTLSEDPSRSVVDRLWNRSVAAWYPGGKDDPTLALLRFDAERAEIWRHESSVFDGVRVMFGGGPKTQRANDVAEVRLS